MEKWDELIEKELRKKINLESFINTIDFTKSKIDKMYYVGNENFLEIFSERLNELDIKINPTMKTKDFLNDFTKVIVNNYNGIEAYPSLKNGVVKLQSYKELRNFDKKTLKPKKWGVSFAYGDVDKEFSEISHLKDIPLVSEETIENDFKQLGHVKWSNTLKKDQKVYPEDLARTFSQRSEFVVVYDKYLFNYRSKSGDETIFAHLRKKLNEEAFERLNLRLTLYLKCIDYMDIVNEENIYIISGSKNLKTDTKYLMENYKRNVDKRINLLENEKDNESIISELNDLKLIKKYYDKFLLVQYGTSGEKTGIDHNRIIFNDHAFIEWGSGQAAFSRGGFSSKYWHINELQTISSSSIFNSNYKELNTEEVEHDNKKYGAYNFNFDALKEYCEDFQNDLIPVGKG